MRSDKIRVLHVIKSLGRGGAEILLPETLQLHNRDRFEFHYIYFLPWKDQVVPSLEKQGVPVTCFRATNTFSMIMQIPALVRYVREHKIKLIHSHLPWAGIVSRIVGRNSGIPVIYSEHNKLERYHSFTRGAHLLTLNMLSEIVAVSKDVAESIRVNKPKLRIPIRLVRNGVNTYTFAKHHFAGVPIRQRFNIPIHAPIVGTIAVFRTQKRLDLWMELAAEITKQVRDVHFIMVGDGPLKNDLMGKREQLGLTDRIHMPGLETNVGPYLAAFSVYMMCSRFEGLPIALLEAMSMECPPVSTDAGGIKEVIRHGVDGFLSPVEKAGQLVEYVCRLLEDEDLRLKCGEMSRRRIIQHYSMNQMVTDLESIYTRLAQVEN